MFHRFDEEEPSDQEIDAWTERIAHLLNEGGKISLIQVYTTARKPAQENVLPLSKERLDLIAEQAREVVDRYNSDTTVLVYG